ncbi:MAG TPA: DUF2237 family protein, partial [Solirubrobacteraceae bacterium]|nr:DUF2237 family protein [Solirubrobacteraceae bacterium]
MSTPGRDPDVNVVGGELLACSTEPLTGFFREGCCSTGPEDLGSHTVCANGSSACRTGSTRGSAGASPRASSSAPASSAACCWRAR